MTGALDPIPDLVSKIQSLQSAVYELQRRTIGATDPLAIGDMVDVQDDGLVDGTITKADGSFLSWRASDGVWIPTTVTPGTGGTFPVVDLVGTAQIESFASGNSIATLGTGDFAFDADGKVDFNGGDKVRFNNGDNVELNNSGQLLVNSVGGAQFNVDIDVFSSVHIFSALAVDDGWTLNSTSTGTLVCSGGADIENVGGGFGMQIVNSGSDSSGFGLTQNDDGGFLFANNGAGMTVINDAGGGFQVIGKLGFFGGTPVSQQSTPVTTADVIALLQAYSLCP